MTSRGPETTIKFALALVERLYGKEKIEEVDGPLVSCKSLNSSVSLCCVISSRNI